MGVQSIRRGIFAERFLVAFAAGLFLSLPLYFQHIERSEVFFAQVYAAGAVGTLLVVSLGVTLLRRFGLARISPWGCALFALGSLMYCLIAWWQGPQWLYFLASLAQGTGWGMVFTMGPICLSCVLTDSERAHLYTIYAAYSTLGMGLAPVLVGLVLNKFGISFAQLFCLGFTFSVLAWCVAWRIGHNNTWYLRAKTHTQLSGWREFLEIIRQPGAVFFTLVFLGACIYTVMINLQTTYAVSQGLNHTVFYGVYSMAVVAARFLLAKSVSRVPAGTALKCLILIMVAALVVLLCSSGNLYLYALGACLMGVGYGLAYPLIQAQLAQHMPVHLRPQGLVYFSLFYFLAVYLFPYVAAQVAVFSGYRTVIEMLIAVALVQFVFGFRFYRSQTRQEACSVGK